jgi:hypothetical protein
MKPKTMNEQIDKIEQCLSMLAANPSGSWVTLLKREGCPYYASVTSYLRKNGIAQENGNGLRWVGKEPTRALAANIYEDAKTASMGSAKKAAVKAHAPARIENGGMVKALALMEKAIKHGVGDPVAFVQDCLSDQRI